MSDRTFSVEVPHLEGNDVKDWQGTLNRRMKRWNVDYRLVPDGDFGIITRDLTASVCHGLGMASAATAMMNGVTPKLRSKLRAGSQTPAEKERFDKRAEWRKAFRERQSGRDVASPLSVILSSSWGYNPPGHDGVDLICKANAPLVAICKAEVIRADPGGWWGKGAPSPAVAAKGDGIIVLRSLTDAGPFEVGLNFGYGHAESPMVKVGAVVEAGDVIGSAGFANAWHIHMMVNKRADARGVGDRDPMTFVDYALAKG